MNRKRIFSLILSVLMMLTLFAPAIVSAEEIELYDEAEEQEFVEDSWYEVMFDENGEDTYSEDVDEVIDEQVIVEDDIAPDYDAIVVEEIEPVNNNVVSTESLTDTAETIMDEPEDAAPEEAEISLIEAESFLDGLLSVTAPAEQTVEEGATATFEVTASGGTGPYTYQWYAYVNSKWVKTGLGGGTSAKIEFAALKDYDGRKFKCTVTDSAGASKTSAAALLTVTDPAPAELSVTAPAEQTVEEGATATFEVTASGGTGPYTYQWYAYVNNKWVKTGLGGGTSAKIEFAALKDYDGRKFKCTVKDSAGASKTSAAALLTVTDSEVKIDGVIYAPLADGSGWYVKGYEGTATSYNIVATIPNDNKPVTEIGMEAFMNNTALSSIVLPNSITVIHERAFKGCTNLSTMTTYG